MRSGVDQSEDRQAHNLEDAGSTPAPALNLDSTTLKDWNMAGLVPSACTPVGSFGAARGVTATSYSQMNGGEN